MPIIRVEKNKNFVTMSKYHLNEKNMSLKAIGLLSIMLSLPDDWNYSVRGLAAIRKESINTINSILKELEQYGYLKRKKLRNEKGQMMETEYIVYEQPCLKNQDMVNQDMEKQDLENRDIDFYSQLNNKELNTKELNNNLTNKLNNKNKYIVEIEEIVDYLNKVCGTSFKSSTSKTRSLIQSRLSENFTTSDFKKVIEKKNKEWAGTDYEKYLRPETLFGNKFEGYLNEKEKKGFLDVMGEIYDTYNNN